MATKTAKQFALSHSTTYTILRSYYTGGLEKGAGCCQNCGKIITNIAVVENKQGETYEVGMDCAATLSGIKDTWAFDQHQYKFSQAKQVRSRLLKLKKQYGADLTVTVQDLDGKKFLDTQLTNGFGCSPYWNSFEPDFYDSHIHGMIAEFL